MSWILTRTGKHFSFVNLHPSQVCIEDIAWSLAHTCRFNGHIRFYYSVAQHCVLVSHVVPTLEALMHDASEAYLGDVTRPLKGLLPGYKEIEARVERLICEKFGLPWPMSPAVKVADNLLLATERRDLMPQDSTPWEALAGVTPLDDEIEPWSPERAYEAFMNRFKELDALKTEH